MEHLRDYLTKNDVRQAAFATGIGVSKGYVTELLNGSKTPSLQLAFRIEAATQGAVPASSWVQQQGAA